MHTFPYSATPSARTEDIQCKIYIARKAITKPLLHYRVRSHQQVPTLGIVLPPQYHYLSSLGSKSTGFSVLTLRYCRSRGMLYTTTVGEKYSLSKTQMQQHRPAWTCRWSSFQMASIRMMLKPSASDTNSTVSTATTCLPSTTATTIEYSVAGSTTTFSSTSTSDTPVPCPPDTCEKLSSMRISLLGSASMGVAAMIEHCESIPTDITTILTTEGCEIATTGGVSSPTQPVSKTNLSSSQDERMMIGSLIAYAFQDASHPYSSYVKSLVPIWIDQPGPVSAQWFNYPSIGHSAVGVKGIYGCTVVIIASEKGVYLSHIWESPVFVDLAFNPTDDDLFTMNAFNSLRDGTLYAQCITGLIGTDHNPGVLNAIHAPKVFVLTPFTTDWDRQYFGISTKLRYQKRAQELAQKIAKIVPGSGGNGIILGYTRTSRQASSQEQGIAGRAILEIDPSYTRLTSIHDSSSAGLQIGRWRLWVEDQLITYQDFWLPHITAPRDISRYDIGQETLIIPTRLGATLRYC